MFAMLTLIQQAVVAQGSDENGDLVKAFKAANVNTIASYLNDNVEIAVSQTDNYYTKQQARSILMNFFRKNSVKDFTIAHNGQKENSSFLIGTLSTSGGTYRVSVFSRKSLIYQLRIEPNND